MIIVDNYDDRQGHLSSKHVTFGGSIIVNMADGEITWYSSSQVYVTFGGSIFIMHH